MAKLTLSSHISSKYNNELEDVRNKVLTMGGLVEQQVADSIDALVEGNTELAEQVIRDDYKVNALEVAIDEEVHYIIARRSPTASDLRMLMMIVKTITDLERIGDEAEKIGNLTVFLCDNNCQEDLYSSLVHLGRDVVSQLASTLDAFARMDIKAAYKLAEKDKKIDQAYDTVVRQMITHMMEDPRKIKLVLNILWSARALERIGDHAKNICEYVIFMVEGKDVRHTSRLQAMKSKSDA